MQIEDIKKTSGLMSSLVTGGTLDICALWGLQECVGLARGAKWQINVISYLL